MIYSTPEKHNSLIKKNNIKKQGVIIHTINDKNIGLHSNTYK